MMHRLKSVACVSALAVLATVVFGAGSAYATATGNNPRSVLIILVSWGAGNGSPAAPPDSVTPQSAAAQVGVTDSAWAQEVSYGQFPGWTANAIGWYNIAPPPGGYACDSAYLSAIEHEGKAAAADHGYYTDNYSVVMYYFSYSNYCGWGGAATLSTIFINGIMDTLVTVHELGHTLGLGHGHALECYDASNNPVPLSTYCINHEYWDTYSVMGAFNAGHFTAIQKADLGWMWGRMLDVPETGGTYRLAPLEITGPFFLYALRIVDGSTTLWVEYRQPIGADSFLPPQSTGVVVHQQMPDDLTQLGSYLLDMTPDTRDTPTYTDAPLPVGATWTNPLGSMKITVDWADGGAAQVTITSTIVRVTVPDLSGETVDGARTVLQEAGLRLGSVANVVDPTCNNVGLVMGQSPTAGTIVIQDSAVSVRVGKAPAAPRTCP